VPVLAAPVTTESTVYLIFNQMVPIIDFHSHYTWFYCTTGKIIAAQGPQTKAWFRKSSTIPKVGNALLNLNRLSAQESEFPLR
jgi:hypothetical protein